VTRIGDQIDPESMDALASPRCANVAGFSLHANVSVPAGDRQRLERLARYCARPPIAMERLEPLTDGRLLYRFKRPWRDGTTHVVFEGLEFLEKLSALVPAPKAHLVRYAGILAPAAKWRALIVRGEPAAESAAMSHSLCGTEPAACATESLPAGAPAEPPRMKSPDARHERNYTWSELMKRVWALDVLECPRCLSRMRILTAIHPPDTTRKILECLGLPSRAPPVAPAASKHPAPPEWF
jgi:hypothetical protein